MSFREELLTRLATRNPCSYLVDSPLATEPTCVATLALAAYDRAEMAQQGLLWLGRYQSIDGSIGVSADDCQPCWPTAWAVLATTLASPASTPADQPPQFDPKRGAEWLLSVSGYAQPRTGTTAHDPGLKGWPWVQGTHSWVEPTALAVLALKASGHTDHPRTREAVRLLQDRLLSGGGCNYGNTIVLKQELIPHLQPTGVALLALRGEHDANGRIERSLDYLEDAIGNDTAASSLSYSLMALAAHGRRPQHASLWLEAAYRRSLRLGAPPLSLALIALALLGARGPLVRATQVELAAV